MTTDPRPVFSLNRKQRWACRACGRSYRLRTEAETCCTDADPAALRGGEILPAGHRSHEHVLEQLEARMRELEVEARRRKEPPPSPYPCAECKWSGQLHKHHCEQPLVKGFEQHGLPHVDYQLGELNVARFPSRNWPTVELCGREKALWEPNYTPPELTRAQHFWKWLFG